MESNEKYECMSLLFKQPSFSRADFNFVLKLTLMFSSGRLVEYALLYGNRELTDNMRSFRLLAQTKAPMKGKSSDDKAKAASSGILLKS